MAPEPSNIRVLSPASVKLGRLITKNNISLPTKKYYDPQCPAVLDIVETPGLSNQSPPHLSNKAKKKNLSLGLTPLISIQTSSNTVNKTQVTVGSRKWYELKESDEAFQEAMAEENARKWIEREYEKGERMYFLVAYKTETDVSESWEEMRVVQNGNAAGLAPSSFSNAVPLPLSLEGSTFGINTSSGQDIYNKGQLHIEGEHICELGYQRIRVRTWRFRGIQDVADKASLQKKISWVYTGRFRGPHDSEGFQDIISVELTEKDDFEDDESDVDDNLLKS